MKVCHLTSAHPRKDIRIFLKECQSLAEKGYEVNLVVADSLGNETAGKIEIFDVGKLKSRLWRFTITSWKVYKKAKKINAAIYHFHDPELMFFALLLKWKGKKVIYDSHEDFPQTIVEKEYLPKWIRRIVMKFFKLSERIVAKRYDGIIAATPAINKKFETINSTTIVINNYPFKNEFFPSQNNESSIKENMICFVGLGTEIRGLTYLIKALQYVNNVRLVIAGNILPEEYKETLQKQNIKNNVEIIGQISRNAVSELLSKSKAGIVTYLPYPNHINSQPNKLFEYMSAGIPVICSDFPLWKNIVLDGKCGITVNPKDEKDISKAINYILTHEQEGAMMGNNGRKAILEKYNWEQESRKLCKFYEGL